MADVLIAGHSHLNAINHALEVDPPELGVTFRTALLLHEKYAPAMQGDGAIVGLFREHLKSRAFRALALTVAGNDHNTLGLVNPPERFDFVLPQEPDLPLDPDARLVPAGTVVDSLQHLVRYSVMFLNSVRAELADMPVFLLEPPPPISSATHIREFGGVFASAMDQYGVASANLRYKLWRVQSELYRAAADAAKMTFLPVPPEARDASGMLAEAAWGQDATHANRWYGERVLHQIAEAIR